MQSSPIALLPKADDRDDQDDPIRRERLIGQLLSQSRGLRPTDIDSILLRQQEHGGRFGEIAIAMRLATEQDVLEALAAQFDYPFVGSLGDDVVSAELVCACDPLGEDAQSFRDLRTELLAGVLAGPTPRAVAVLSPQRRDGRSYVAANLAVAFAQLGGKTLLVDADMRSPRQHTLLRAGNAVGLSQLLAQRAGAEEAVQPTVLPGLFLVGAGPLPPNPLELLLRGSRSKLIHDWLRQFDYVVMDTPPANQDSLARVIAELAGAALVVARPQISRMNDLDRLVRAVGKGHVELAGVVMNEH